MEAQGREKAKVVSSVRPYIVRHLRGIGAAVVIVAALSVGWPVYDVVAQVDAAAHDGVLRVGQCIDANDSSVALLEKALIEHDIIEEDLLQTKVTNGMCEDILAQTPDGTPVRRFLAAQNYMQEIKLIDEAMRRAGGEAAAKATNRHFLATRLSVVAWTFVAPVQGVAEAQYRKPAPGTAEPAPDGAGPPAPGTAEPAPGGAGAPAPGTAEPAPTGPRDGEEDGTGDTPTRKQAAAAASAGEDGDASIADMLRQKEDALRKAGASVPEARAGARCGTEVQVSDEGAKKIEGQFEIIPQMPREMRLREKEQAGLLVSPATKKRFEEMRQKHEVIDEESESGIGCVELVDRMKAQLVPLDLEGLSIYRQHPDDIRELSSNRDTRWSWGITARQTGNLELLLDLRYAISREGQEFRLVPDSPVYAGAIWVTTPQSDSLLPGRYRQWLWVSIIGVVASAVITLVALFLLRMDA